MKLRERKNEIRPKSSVLGHIQLGVSDLPPGQALARIAQTLQLMAGVARSNGLATRARQPQLGDA